MRCKTCGTQLSEFAGFCPNCGVTVHRSAGQAPPLRKSPAPVPVNNERPVYVQMPQPAPAPVPVPQPAPVPVPPPVSQIRRQSSNNDIWPVLMTMLSLLMCSLGTFWTDFIKLRYESLSDSVYNGINYSMGYREMFSVGMSEFFREQDPFTNTVMAVIPIFMLAALGLASAAGVFTGRKNSGTALRLLGIGHIFPAISYILTFLNAIYIRSTYIDDGFSGDKCTLAGGPIAMLLICISAMTFSFMASGKKTTHS